MRKSYIQPHVAEISLCAQNSLMSGSGTSSLDLNISGGSQSNSSALVPTRRLYM